MAGGGVASRSGLLSKVLRPQSSDVQAAAMWGVAAATGALWLIQPFDWLKKTFLEKPQAEGQQLIMQDPAFVINAMRFK